MRDADESPWRHAVGEAAALVSQDVADDLSFAVGRRGENGFALQCDHRAFRNPDASSTPATGGGSEQRYLVASLTKPMVTTAVMQLVERGEFTLADKVSDWFPEFGRGDRRKTTVFHLLTHTSGLPDHVPNSLELRKAHAPLSEFVRATLDVPLEFAVGQGSQYSSMAFALLGRIVELVSGQSLPEYLRSQLFIPLGMQVTSLGQEAARPGEEAEREAARIRVPEFQLGGDDWNWNSSYWRGLGSPWGGVLSTAVDVSQFCRLFLDESFCPDILARGTRRAMIANRLHDVPDVPEWQRRSRGWGLGWRIDWAGHWSTFCDVRGAGDTATIGHYGSTGCVMWLDLAGGLAVVILSNAPVSKRQNFLLNLSNILSSAADRQC